VTGPPGVGGLLPINPPPFRAGAIDSTGARGVGWVVISVGAFLKWTLNCWPKFSKNCARSSKTSDGSKDREELKQRAISDLDNPKLTTEQRAKALVAFMKKTEKEK
jgi:hypothetical protein